MKQAERDCIFIEGLKIDMVIGVHPWERCQTQPVYIDVQLYRSLAQAGQTDQLGDTLDYAAVAQSLATLCKNTQFELLETLAQQLINHLFQQFGVLDAVKLTLHKPQAITNAKDVGLSLYRERTD
ncbi:MAG: dihydroneopterin aldolase [Thiomicrospira sp.]